jgi:hypothetical protein
MEISQILSSLCYLAVSKSAYKFYIYRQCTYIMCTKCRFNCFQWCPQGPLWSWSSGSWAYNYLCNQWLSPLKSWVRTPFMACVLDTTLCDKVCQWLATGRWFSLGTPVSSINKTGRHDITEILLKVVLNTINQQINGVLYHVHTYTVTISYHLLYMNEVPERLYLSQSPNITKNQPVSAIWLLK